MKNVLFIIHNISEGWKRGRAAGGGRNQAVTRILNPKKPCPAQRKGIDSLFNSIIFVFIFFALVNSTSFLIFSLLYIFFF